MRLILKACLGRSARGAFFKRAFCAFLAALSVQTVLTGSEASAQIAGQTPPTVITPLMTEPDRNAVNITDGRIRIGLPTLAIPAAPRLRVDEIQNVMPYLVARLGGSGYIESSVSVNFGGASSESFSCLYDDVCTNHKGNGSVLDGSIANGGPYSVILSPIGAVYTFDQLSYDTGAAQQSRQVIYFASSIAYPDGEVISFTYETARYSSGQGATQFRVSRMSSSAGYYITFAYQGNDVAYDAWKTVAQTALYKASDPGSPLTQLSYTAGTVTDQAGRVYNCAGCDFRVGGQVELSSAALTLPGEPSATESVTATSFSLSAPSLVTSVNRDGVNWIYAYTNFRTLNSPVGYGYDKVVVSGPSGFQQTYNILVGGQKNPNLISSVVDSIGRTTSYTYDGSSRVTRVVYPEGNAVQVTYDQWGNITTKTNQPKPGSGLAATTESSTIDTSACGLNQVLCYRVTSYTDTLGRVTNYAYDAAGRMVQRTDPADSSGVRRATYLTYGASFTAPTQVRVCGLGTTCGTSAEMRTDYTYLGQSPLPLSETRTDAATGSSLTTSFTYDNAGRLLSMDGPLPGASDAQYFRYDVVGRKTWEISAAGVSGARIVKRYTYRDADDKVIVIETGTLTDVNATSFVVTSRIDTSYDSRRYAVREALSAGGTLFSVSDRSFDDGGRMICAATRLNLAALPAVGSSACALGTAGTFGPDRITQNSYDAAGQLLKVTKALGTSAQSDDATYTYSLNGRPTSLTDANGNLMTMAYDGFDRQIRWTFPSPTTPGTVNAADYEAYGYDAAGNRLSFRKRDGSTLTYIYDNLNRVIMKAVPARAGLAATNSRSVYYGYDIRGMQTYARFDSASGEGVTLVYDGFGRLASSTLAMDGVSRTIGYQYDAAGNRTQLTHPDGTSFFYHYDPASRPYYTDGLFHTPYDDLGRVTALYRNVAGTWSIPTAYYYDGVSRVTASNRDLGGTSADSSATFAYNPASQIVSRTQSNDAYAWTGAVNAQRGYSVNGLNQYTAAGTAAFTYDANGNLTSDGASTYVYDVENRLVSASGATNATLRYDPLGRLYETTGGATGVTRFLYDGDALIAEYDASGAMLRRYVHGVGADVPLVWYEGASITSPRHLYADHQGSIIAVADAAGTPIAIDSYDEYGIPGAANVGRFGYTGQAWIPELGMYYYKARIYSPTLGRFLQTDPIGNKDQINLYAYVGDDPVDGKDPSGLYQCAASAESACNRVDAAARVIRSEIRATQIYDYQTRSQLRQSLSQIGTRNDGNGTTVTSRTIAGCLNACASVQGGQRSVNFSPTFVSGASNVRFSATTAHEFGHISDFRSWGIRNDVDLTFQQRYDTERLWTPLSVRIENHLGGPSYGSDANVSPDEQGRRHGWSVACGAYHSVAGFAPPPCPVRPW